MHRSHSLFIPADSYSMATNSNMHGHMANKGEVDDSNRYVICTMRFE